MADFAEQFRIPHSREIVREILGPNCLKLFSDDFGGHPVWVVDHPKGYDIDAAMPTLRARLDEIEWQVMVLDLKDGPRSSSFAFAPLWFETASTLYHVTPSRLVGVIFRDGLLPSDETRSLTNFPDTLGKIHGSRILIDQPGTEDGATRWQNDFSQQFGEPFSILEVNLAGLPKETRLYRDIHSEWGLIVDRVSCIPPNDLRLVDDSELIDAGVRAA